MTWLSVIEIFGIAVWCVGWVTYSIYASRNDKF